MIDKETGVYLLVSLPAIIRIAELLSISFAVILTSVSRIVLMGWPSLPFLIIVLEYVRQEINAISGA